MLIDILRACMAVDHFDAFRLIGGTALSLQIGHRLSLDLDLFTDAPYQSIDFEAIEKWFSTTFPYVQSTTDLSIGLGKPYFVGKDPLNCIKLDLYYTDSFIDELVEVDGLRLASIKEIIAMKMDVIMRGGRKKDFWDIHELSDDYSVDEMLDLHQKRYPFTHERNLIISNLTNFKQADEDFEPRCLRGKHWELIKLDLLRKISICGHSDGFNHLKPI